MHTLNYLQTSACLYEDGVLSDAALAAVARVLIEESAYTPERLANSLADIARRGHLRATTAAAVHAALRAADILPAPAREPLTRRWRTWWTPRRRAAPAMPVAPPAGVIDYRAIVGMEAAAEAAPE